MANALTPHVRDLYVALDYVSRELIGMIPAVSRDSRLETAAVGQVINSFVSPTSNASFDHTPAMAIPAASDFTLGNNEVIITKSKGVPFSMTGNDQVGLGSQFLSVKQGNIAQGMRTLLNLVEADLTGLCTTTSRAYGTVGTVPFTTANDYTELSQTLRILADNGGPEQGNQCVMNTASAAQLMGKQAAAYQQGSADLLRQGVMAETFGCQLRRSAQIITQTAGTMASATSSNAAFTVGQTAIPLATAGTGVVAAGDIITFANDTNKYVVASVAFAGANPASGDVITLAAPGLRLAQSAATRAITVIATCARNMVFNQNALYLATRLPTRPAEGDLAIDVMTLTDPRTNLSFEVAVYPGQRMVRYEIGIAWGVKNVKPEHTAILIGS